MYKNLGDMNKVDFILIHNLSCATNTHHTKDVYQNL